MNTESSPYVEHNVFTCDRPQASQNRGRSAHIRQVLIEVLITQSVPLLQTQITKAGTFKMQSAVHNFLNVFNKSSREFYKNLRNVEGK